jgi:polynucleotide 5'-triphosphatase
MSDRPPDHNAPTPPAKRARLGLGIDETAENGETAPVATSASTSTMSSSSSASSPQLPPLSLSILGVEPLDEFILDVADFVHHMINTRPPEAGTVEVEAKIGVLRDKVSGQRLRLPVRVETSSSYI